MFDATQLMGWVGEGGMMMFIASKNNTPHEQQQEKELQANDSCCRHMN